MIDFKDLIVSDPNKRIITRSDGTQEHVRIQRDFKIPAGTTPVNRQTARLLQADIERCRIASEHPIDYGDVVDVVAGAATKHMSSNPIVTTQLIRDAQKASYCTYADRYILVSRVDTSSALMLDVIDSKTTKVIKSVQVVAKGVGVRTSAITVLSPETIVVVYDYLYTISCKILTINSDFTSITVGRETKFYTAGTGNTRSVSVCKVTENTFVATYCEVMDESGVQFFTVSGDVATAGTSVKFPGEYKVNYICPALMSNYGSTSRVFLGLTYKTGGFTRGGAALVSISSKNIVSLSNITEVNRLNNSLSCVTIGDNVLIIGSSVSQIQGNQSHVDADIALVRVSGDVIRVLDGASPPVHVDNTMSFGTIGNLGDKIIWVYGELGIVARFVSISNDKIVLSDKNTLIEKNISVTGVFIPNLSSKPMLIYTDGNNVNVAPLKVVGNTVAGSFKNVSRDAIALQRGTTGTYIDVVHSGNVYVDWATAGRVINSEGVYGNCIRNGVLKVWSKNRPEVVCPGGGSTPTDVEAAAKRAEAAAEKAEAAVGIIDSTIVDNKVSSATLMHSKPLIDLICDRVNETAQIVESYPVPTYPLTVETTITFVQEGTNDPSPRNVRPIHGFQNISVTNCGVNLLPLSKAVQYQNCTLVGETIRANMKDNSFMQLWFSTPLLELCQEGTKLTLEFEGDIIENSRCGIFLFKSDKSTTLYSKYSEINKRKVDITIPRLSEQPAFVTLRFNNIYPNKTTNNEAVISGIKLMFTANIQEYEPYRGTTISQDLKEEVFGGLYNWETGILTKTYASKITTEVIVTEYDTFYTIGNATNGGVPNGEVVTNIFKGVTSAAGESGRNDLLLNKSYLETLGITSLGELKSLLNRTALQCVYKLYSPVMVQLTGQISPAASYGVNFTYSSIPLTTTVQAAESPKHTHKILRSLISAMPKFNP